MGPLEAEKPWNTDDTIGGIYRFLQRAWRAGGGRRVHGRELVLAEAADEGIERAAAPKSIARVGERDGPD